MEKANLVLTGGHAGTTALAAIEELKKRKDKFDWNIFWIGPKHAVEGKSALSLEAKVLPDAGVKFYPIIAGRIQTVFTLWTIPALLKIPLGFLHAFWIVFRIRPKAIVSFGGFAAFPVVVVGWLFRIPVIIHEQTSAVGRANKHSSFFAKKIALAREESRRYFPSKKSIVIGNPILGKYFGLPAKRDLGNTPVIFVTGGSRGSMIMNKTLDKILERLLEKYQVIHQAGIFEAKRFIGRMESLPESLKTNYKVFETIDPYKMVDIYKVADIVVSRAGANAVSEIIATKRPAILIPIPFSYLDEQTKNAQFAQDYGIAEILKQDDLSPDNLYSKIESLALNWQKMIDGVIGKESPDKGASVKLADIVEEEAG